jgi:ubiquinone/menaquinone biosynthesis C-methylase UbiE
MRIKKISSEDTKEFYNNLMHGKNKRSIAGKDNRYNAELLSQKPSVIKYFDGFLLGKISKEDKILDFGCGPGTFSIRLARICKEVVSVDIVESFIESAENSFNNLKLNNVTPIHITSNNVPYPDSYFDSVILMDVVHHLEDIDNVFLEIQRVLKPQGKIIIFEPNKINPIIFLIHYLDPNEQGLIRLGTPIKYTNILNNYSKNIDIFYSGIVLGPQSKIYDFVSYLLNNKYIYRFLGWLNPKIALVCTNDK